MKFTPAYYVRVWKETPGATANSDGQLPETQTEVCRRWAEIHPLRGQERMLADQQQADITCRVRLVYDETVATISERMWLTMEDGTRLNIVAAYDPDMRRQYYVLDCNQRK